MNAHSRFKNLVGLPDTAFAAAYLKALTRKVKTADLNTIIVIPTGPAVIHEIKRALGNLKIRNATLSEKR